ncbi:hypothetical protein BGX27_005730, partial [Mortierella sp. AM989]
MLRTATTTMKQILRPDLLNHYGTIIQTLTLKQATITETMDELAILAHKTTLLAASGAFTGALTDEGFHIKEVLPAGFEIDTVVPVARIPPTLQEELLTPQMTEVKNLLSQPHLQYLYTRFMGTNNVTEKTPRRLWDKGVDLLRPSVNVAELPNPEGLSATINEHI